MDNMTLYNKFRSVPQEAKKTITGGRLNGFTDINPMWRIKALTEAFGACGFGWWYKITDKRIECYGNEYRAFIDIELYYVLDGKESKPVVGTGGASFVTMEKSGGAYVSDECFKMALTDAISVAAKSLGVGADVYYEKDRDKYTVPEEPKADPKPDPKSEPQAKVTPSGYFQPTCKDCGKKITVQEHDWGVKWYGAPLCRECQKKHPKKS